MWAVPLKVEIVHTEMLTCQAWPSSDVALLVEHHLSNLALNSKKATVRKILKFITTLAS